MSDITPKPIAGMSPAGVAPITSITAAAAPPATASAAEIPAAIANLSVGTFVTGTVIERGPRGLAVLRTDKGTIKLYSPIPLKQGSTITLQIQSVGAQVQLSILSIDGQPLAHPLAKTPAAAVPARPDSAIKSTVGDGPHPRSPPSSAVPSASTTVGTGESMPAGTVGGDRAVGERGTLSRPAAAPAMASGFIARPLIATTSAAGLQALSPAQAPSPSLAGVTTDATPALATTPQTVAVGARFVATFAGPPVSETASLPQDSAALRAPTNPGATSPLPTPSAGPAAVTAPATAAPDETAPATAIPTTTAPLATTPATQPPAQTPDHVILRLLGIELPSQSNTAPKPPGVIVSPTSGAPPAGGGPTTTGPTAASNAMTMVGTIIADGESANFPAGSTPQASSTAARTLINTPFGVLTVAGSPPGPAGTKLLLEVVLGGGAPLPAPDHPELPTWLATSTVGRGHDMPTLRGIMAAAQSLPADIADHLLNAAVPRPGPQLAAGLLFFVAALRQGGPRAWLGERTLDALQHGGHGALIDKLTDEFAGLARLASEASPNGWQTLLLPLVDGGRLQQIRLHLRRPRRKGGERQDGTRFMIEAELSKFGPLQLDGLVSKPQFDLVVRTRTALPPEVRGDIIDIYSDALAATNLKGAVSFQAVPDIRPGPPASDTEAGIGFIV